MNNRWTKRITDLCPNNDKRIKKRRDTRWGEEIEKFAGKTWQRIAQDSHLLNDLGKAYLQQWTYKGCCC